MRLAILIAALVVSTPIFATDLLSSKFNACVDKNGGVTVEMLDCIGAQTQRQDAALKF